MQFKTASEIFEKFPGLTLGVLLAQGIDNQGTNAGIMNLIRQKEEEIRENFNPETLPQNPQIDVWRQAYSAFGAKPKKHQCSVENLYRMILDRIDLRSINKIVDIYNYISLKYLVPVGGDDLDQVDGDIALRFAQGDEPFRALNSEEIQNPRQGEVVYADQKEILCRRWNWRECNKSKMTEETKNVILVVEGLRPVTKEKIKRIVKELGGLVKKYCGGEIKHFILDRNKPSIKL